MLFLIRSEFTVLNSPHCESVDCQTVVVFRREVENTAGAGKAFQVFDGVTDFFFVGANQIDGATKDFEGIVSMTAKGAGRLIEFALVICFVFCQQFFLGVAVSQQFRGKQFAGREDDALGSSTADFNVLDVAETVALEQGYLPTGLPRAGDCVRGPRIRTSGSNEESFVPDSSAVAISNSRLRC